MSAYLSIQEGAEYLSVSTKTVRRLIARTTLPASRIKGTTAIRIRRADLDRLCVAVREA